MTGSLAERLAGLAVLGAVPWPLFFALASRQYWRVFPRIARILALLLLGYAAILAAIVLAAPLPVFRVLYATGLIVLAGTFWYSRDAFGRNRGWPRRDSSLLRATARSTRSSAASCRFRRR